jgi:Sugar (pentulose and hexulose) kinases
MQSQTHTALALGIDIGTSGVRIAAVDSEGRMKGFAAKGFTRREERHSPAAWWSCVEECFGTLAGQVDLNLVAAVSVDGTSGTVLALDSSLIPRGRALMYDETCPDPAIVSRLDALVPESSTARGPYSALARAVYLARKHGARHIVHQADWIAIRLGASITSDENNALKTGYDLETGTWPEWIQESGLGLEVLPEVKPAGSVIGPVGEQAVALGLPPSAVIVNGTTDGCASFLATGASEPGDGVTALGSTLVLKLLSDRRIDAPAYGVYSHRIAGMWLAGGASNTGGAVIRHFFEDRDLPALTARLEPDRPTGLDYYPLLGPGERFPVNDPALPPRLEPRPADNATFFQALLEGIAAVEDQGYRRLEALGAPALRSVRSVGGGAANEAWARIRQKRLGVPFLPALSTEAAVGTALLAWRALRQ